MGYGRTESEVPAKGLKGTDASGKEIIVYVSERHLVSVAPI